MGYRSEVRAVIYGTEQDLSAHIHGQVILFNSIVISDFKDYLNRYVVKHKDQELNVLELHMSNTKWYPEYEDVAQWMEFMEQSITMNLQYEFIRIGEEPGDVEENHSTDPEFFLSTTRPETYLDIPETIRQIPLTS